MSSRLWFWSATVLLAIAGPVAAQAPSKLDLARGIRESGMPDLALEYLKEIESSPLTDLEKQAILLEKAKCLLESAEDEPDEGTRTSLVGEAKDGFRQFLTKNASHPRAAEASIALAKLTAIDARIQLNRARKIDVGDDDELKKKQQEESAAARPLFQLASKLFADAAQQIKAKLADGNLDPGLRVSLGREAFEADLAAAINLYNMAGTYLASNAKGTEDRANQLDKARDAFAVLAKGPPTSRTVWVAKAWMAETLMDQGKPNDGEAEFKAILAVNAVEAEEGKRIVRFFQIRRAYLNALTDATKLAASEKDIRAWLSRYGAAGKQTPEAISMRYYLAFDLQVQAEIATPKPKTGPPPPPTGAALRQYKEAEKLYRVLSQTDNDYTQRASKNRMYVVRRMLGEADQPVQSYDTFENAQMAALIQMAKLGDAEKDLPRLIEAAASVDGFFHALPVELKKRRGEWEVKHRKVQILALLERARELATDKDSSGDVTDNLLRLVYYYQINNQPYQAAVLGEFIAKTVKSSGGKSALAGLLGLNGYLIAAKSIKVDTTNMDSDYQDAIAARRKSDRERAVALARLLDEKYPNDTATDAARHTLASLLVADKKFAEAFTIIVKVRPGYADIASVRLLEGYIANVLITTPAKDMPQPPGGKPAVFQQAIVDLNRVAKPADIAREKDVKDYLSVRARLSMLFLAQSRAESKQADASGPGYEKALVVAEEMLGIVPTFHCLKDKESGKLTPLGLELHYLGIDTRTRAVYIRCKTMVDAKDVDLEKAAGTIVPVIEDIEKNGPAFDETMKKWAGDEDEQKVKVAALAQSIDRVRRDIVMLGFKLRVRQGNPAKANDMLELLVKAGGSIEENQPTLEFMARDLAAQIPILKKEGKTAEAKAMGDGLAILLKKLGAIPNLTSQTILFLGQTLLLVEQYDDALKEFAKIPVPVPPKQAAPMGNPPPKGNPNWWEIDLSKLENNPDKKKFQDQIRDYRAAQLYTARCFRGLNKLPDAEKLLTGAIGAPEKPGFASSSLDYRRELAFTYEAKGATLTGKEANIEWGKALKEWTTLYNAARNEVARLKDAEPDKERMVKSHFFDSYFEVQRCLLLANSQLQKGNPKLDQTFADSGKKISDLETSNKLFDLEKKGAGIVTPEVWNHYADLLDKYPQLKNGYKAAGGKLFLERPKD